MADDLMEFRGATQMGPSPVNQPDEWPYETVDIPGSGGYGRQLQYDEALLRCILLELKGLREDLRNAGRSR